MRLDELTVSLPEPRHDLLGVDPRVKVIAVTASAAMILCTWNAIALLACLTAILAFTACLRALDARLLRLVRASAPFLAIFIVTLAISSPSEYVRGLVLGTCIALKLASIVCLVHVLVSTTRVSDVIASLRSLGLPKAVAWTLAISIRYVQEMSRALSSLYASAMLRGLELKLRAYSLRALGSLLVNLIVRAADECESVARAMRLRALGDLPDLRLRSRGSTRSGLARLTSLMTAVAIVLALDLAGLLPCPTP